MKKLVVLMALVLASIGFAPDARAQSVPQALPLQGVLTDGMGVPLSGTVYLRATMDVSLGGGTPVYERVLTVDLEDGHFATELPLDASAIALFQSGPAVELGLAIATAVNSDPSTDTVLGAPFQVATAPYALVAEYAAEADFAMAAGQVDWAAVTGVPGDIADGDDTIDTTLLDDGSTLTMPVGWDDITGKPSIVSGAELNDGDPNTLPVTWADINNPPGFVLPGALVDNSTLTAPVGWDDITGKPTLTISSELSDSNPSTTPVTWDDVSSKPAVVTAGELSDSNPATTPVSWSDLVNVPTLVDAADLADSDPLTTPVRWADLSNVPGGFGDGVDNVLSEATVDTYAGNNGYLTSVDWTDIQNRPTGLDDGDDGSVDGTGVALQAAFFDATASITSGPLIDLGSDSVGLGHIVTSDPNPGTGNVLVTGSAGFRNWGSGSSHGSVLSGRANALSNATDGAILSGFANLVAGSWNWVGGGSNNSLSGGSNNAILTGQFTSIAATVTNTIASGRRAKADHSGVFIWADNNDFDFASAAANEVAVRATGGTRIVSAIDGSGNATAGVTLGAGGGAWATLSDRNAKHDVRALDPVHVVKAVRDLPVQRWRYKAEASQADHIGPMAQDFADAFGLGDDRTRITTTDAAGVALAAIKGLDALGQERDREIADLKAANAELRKRLDQREKSPLQGAIPWLGLCLLGGAFWLCRRREP